MKDVNMYVYKNPVYKHEWNHEWNHCCVVKLVVKINSLVFSNFSTEKKIKIITHHAFQDPNKILSEIDNRQCNNVCSTCRILWLRSSNDRSTIKKMTKIYVIKQRAPKTGWPKHKHSSKPAGANEIFLSISILTFKFSQSLLPYL